MLRKKYISLGSCTSQCNRKIGDIFCYDYPPLKHACNKNNAEIANKKLASKGFSMKIFNNISGIENELNNATTIAKAQS